MLVLAELTRVARDTGRIVSHAIGAGPQFDAFVDEKFERLRDDYRSPVLDFGAGTCFFTMRMKEAGLDVTAVDVVDHCRYPAARLRVVDGKSLPFKTGAFETSVAHFVLHHIEDQKGAFAELVRVTRGTIIVSEDVRDSLSDALVTAAHTGTSPWARAWRGFRSTREWLDFFARYPVDVVSQNVIPRWRTPHYPVRRVVFVLRVRQAAA